MRLLLFCLAVLSAVPAAPAQNERAAVNAFEKAFYARDASAPERSAALSGLAGLDSERVAKCLAEAWQRVKREISALEKERAEIGEEIRELLRGQLQESQRTLPRDELARLNELKAKSGSLRDRIDGQRLLLASVGERIGSLRSSGAREWMLDDLVGNRRLPLELRLHGARVVGADDGLVEDLVRAVNRARRSEERIALAAACEELGRGARAAGLSMVEWLRDDARPVRVAAARALARMAVPEAVPEMIDLLDTETGQARRRIARALQVLTGQRHGLSAGAWRGWFEAEGADLDPEVLGGGRGVLPSEEQKGDEHGYYFGLPQDGAGIVYVIDCSDSMKNEIEYRGKKRSRINACKAELVRALGTLTSGTTFNIVAYNDVSWKWNETMAPAPGPKVEEAQAWVLELDHASSTNIHDAMKLAFELSGRGAYDKAYESGVDTIFLLSDGSPTKPDGSLDSTEAVINAVREWNALGRITVHTIGIGRGVNAGFLRALAEENGGQFRRY